MTGLPDPTEEPPPRKKELQPINRKIGTVTISVLNDTDPGPTEHQPNILRSERGTLTNTQKNLGYDHRSPGPHIQKLSYQYMLPVGQ